MPRTKGDVNFEDLPEEDKKDLFEAIRDAHLDASSDGLRKLGVAEDVIAEKRAECLVAGHPGPLDDYAVKLIRERMAAMQK